MNTQSSSIRWGAICAIAAGICFLVPLSFYFYFLPASGSSATHAQDPASFLPWMASRGGVRVALWGVTGLTFVIALLGIPHGLREMLRDSVAGLLSVRLPRLLGGYGIVTGLLTLCFAVGYAAGIRWLGELGIGALSLLAMPAWMIWLGIVLWRAGREIPDAAGT